MKCDRCGDDAAMTTEVSLERRTRGVTGAPFRRLLRHPVDLCNKCVVEFRAAVLGFVVGFVSYEMEEVEDG